MKKALIICAGGMSSSVIAKKTTESLQGKGNEIQVDATSQSQGANTIAKDEYDLYLVSPQTKMYFDSLEKVQRNTINRSSIFRHKRMYQFQWGLINCLT